MHALLLLLAACSDRGDSDSADKGALGPGPWEDLAPVALDPLRPMLSVALDAPVAPTRLVSLPALPWLAVLDGDATHMLDARYQTTSKRECFDPSKFPDIDDGVDRQGSCAAGEAELRRGLWAVSLVAPDPTRPAIWASDGAGTLYRAETELEDVNPLDWMRPDPVGDLPIVPDFLVAATDSTLWLAAGDQLVHVDTDGATLAIEDLSGDALDLVLVGDEPCVATTGGVWFDGGISDLMATRLVSTGDDCVGSSPSESRILGRDLDVSVPGLTGPITRDALTGRIYAATETGLAIVQDGVVTDEPIGPIVDLVDNGHHELATLTADGTVDVYVDETALVGPPALSLMTMAFFENPHEDDSEVSCTQGQETMAAYIASATKNRTLYDDLPSPTALGVSAAVVTRAQDCDYGDELDRIANAERTEVGVLFHEVPDCGTDQDCHDAALTEEAGRFAAAGIDPTWMSGAASHDVETDWVKAVLATGLPAKYLFFGLSSSPDVGSEDVDTRAKEPYPWRTLVPSTPWRVATAADGTTDNPAGELTMYPGQNMPAFNLAACPNLLVKECHILGEGDGVVVDTADVAVLDLLLHRALAGRSDTEGDTFYFHLPAMEMYDYTTDCTVTDRVWSGESCQGAALQAWMFDVHARFVEAGLARWALPSELP